MPNFINPALTNQLINKQVQQTGSKLLFFVQFKSKLQSQLPSRYINCSLLISLKLMQNLQKKRDEFRKQIRKSQLDKIREEKRKTLLEKQLNYDILTKVDAIFSDLQHSLAQTALDQNNTQILINSATQIDEPANFSNVVDCFHRLKAFAPYDFEQIFTKYMIDKKSAQRLMMIFADLTGNQIQNQDQSDGEAKEKYNPILRQRALYEILKFLDTLSYIVLGYDSTIMIIDGLWKVLTDEIVFCSVEGFGFLKYTLSVLLKVLQDPKNQAIYSYMVQKGIGSQIVKFIDQIRKVKVPLQIHDNLLKLINNYLACELANPVKNSQKIGQVTINTSSVNQKEIMLVYCIFFIDKNEEDLYSVVFSALSKLIEIHEFLTSSLKDDYLRKICDLILHPNRQIQVQALNLLNDFTYNSQYCIDYLLKDGYLLDMLHKRLMIESSANDHQVTPNVQKIAYIICNSLLTQKKELKKICLEHYMWEDIILSFHPSNKLFPLIMVMMYFFNANGHKNFEKYLEPYLQALRNFQWEQSKYSDSIRKSIQHTFYLADNNWQQHQEMKFLRILYDYGFLEVVQDLCDPGYIKEIKGIEME